MSPIYLSLRVGKAYAIWTKMGVSTWLVGKLRLGLQLPWTGTPPYRHPRPYLLSTESARFSTTELQWCISKGFVRLTSTSESRSLRRAGHVYLPFVTDTAGCLRLVINYKRSNE